MLQAVAYTGEERSRIRERTGGGENPERQRIHRQEKRQHGRQNEAWE